MASSVCGGAEPVTTGGHNQSIPVRHEVEVCLHAGAAAAGPVLEKRGRTCWLPFADRSSAQCSTVPCDGRGPYASLRGASSELFELLTALQCDRDYC